MELSKLGRGEKMDIHGVGIRLPHIQKKKKRKIDSNNEGPHEAGLIQILK